MTLTWPHPDPSRPTAGVIGWPVDQSLSPEIHTAAYRQLGMEWDYLRLPVEPGEMPAAVQRLAADGFVGANVTMPHKDAAAELARERTDDARVLDAVNTLERIDAADPAAGFRGHNTDAPGFADFLAFDAGVNVRGAAVTLFGSGGAARACALAMARLAAGTITVAVRDLAKAEGVRDAVVAAGTSTAVDVVGFDDASRTPADLIVNATPLGAAGERLPHPALGSGCVVVDLLYRPLSTPLQASALEAGGRAYGGLGLLVRQAAHAFEIWTGRPAPVEAMWGAVGGAPPRA